MARGTDEVLEYPGGAEGGDLRPMSESSETAPMTDAALEEIREELESVFSHALDEPIHEMTRALHAEVVRLRAESLDLRMQAMARNRANWQTGIDLTIALDRWEALLPEGADRAELDAMRARRRPTQTAT